MMSANTVPKRNYSLFPLTLNSCVKCDRNKVIFQKPVIPEGSIPRVAAHQLELQLANQEVVQNFDVDGLSHIRGP